MFQSYRRLCNWNNICPFFSRLQREFASNNELYRRKRVVKECVDKLDWKNVSGILEYITIIWNILQVNKLSKIYYKKIYSLLVGCHKYNIRKQEYFPPIERDFFHIKNRPFIFRRFSESR